MTIFKDYLLAWFGSVSMKNTNYLVECCILKEYVDIDLTPQELEEKLFSVGFEVEGLDYL